MTLQEFSAALRGRLDNPNFQRPFICDGNPFECQVFIVGINPATEMKASFWDFWSDQVGFDKSSWFDVYKRERSAKPLKPGRKRKNEVSTTRKYMNLITDSCKPIKCLETNLYSYPSAEPADLTAFQKHTLVFDWLVETIRPQFILALGDETIDHVSRLTHSHLAKHEINDVLLNGDKVIVLPTNHLASRRGDWSIEKAMHVGKQIKELI